MVEKFISTRRYITSAALHPIFPSELDRQTKTEELKQLEGYLQEGYGAVGFVLHFSDGDFPRVLETFFRNSKEIRKRDILVPIAQNQVKRAGVRQLSRVVDVTLAPVVTSDTKRTEEKLIAEGKESEIYWGQHPKGHGGVAYLSKATEVLRDGGIVLLAPQGGRRTSLQPFDIQPVTRLTHAIQAAELQKVVFFFVGLEIGGVNDYSVGGIKGADPFKKYVIKIGSIMTSESFSQSAKRNSKTLEQEAYAHLVDLSPEAYRPQ